MNEPTIDDALVEACLRASTADEVRAVLLAAFAGPRGDDPRLSRLTAREREVAELAGDDLTDQEIGRTLYISKYTVNSHLKKIFEKLEINRRSQLRAFFGRSEPARERHIA